MIGIYRDEFPVAGQWSFLNHAAVAPLSRRVHTQIKDWADDYLENGNAHEAKWWGEMEVIRRRAARMINSSETEIALVKNTSEGLAFVAEGFPWQQGDNVVIAEGEYPANVYPWMHLADKHVSVKTVPCRNGRIVLDDLAAAVDQRTRLLSLSHVQFATGFRSDLAAVGDLCRHRGIDFCVDAIQSLGVFPIDVRAMNIDYLSADGHKWLCAPEGAALFYIRQDRIEKIRPITVGWKSVVGKNDYSTIDFRLTPTAARYECGTFNICGNLGLGASLSLFEEIGIPAIRQAVREITDYLVGRIEAMGYSVYSSRTEDEWSGIVSFEVAGADPKSLVGPLKARKVVVAARGGRLRVSPHFYNNRVDVDRLVEALAELRPS